MTILNIFQIITGIIILFIVTMQVKKDSTGLAGLMGNSTNNKNKSSNIDKATKYMLFLVILFMISSFGVSYQKSQSHKSIVTTEIMQNLDKGKTDVK